MAYFATENKISFHIRGQFCGLHILLLHCMVQIILQQVHIGPEGTLPHTYYIDTFSLHVRKGEVIGHKIDTS